MDLSKINALCLGGGTSKISYKEINKNPGGLVRLDLLLSGG